MEDGEGNRFQTWRSGAEDNSRIGVGGGLDLRRRDYVLVGLI